nr:hypothetical protein [Kiritimatiellia bacterium]
IAFAQTAPTGGAAARQVFEPSRAREASTRVDGDIAQLQREMQELRKEYESMSRRLGRAQQAPTTFNTFERRMEELQRQVDRLEKALNARIRKLEDQVQRLERQSKGRP